jgi:hypothetical protein
VRGKKEERKGGRGPKYHKGTEGEEEEEEVVVVVEEEVVVVEQEVFGTPCAVQGGRRWGGEEKEVHKNTPFRERA